jgi:hypothetical protein
MLSNALFLLLLAHILGDVVFASYKLSVLKRSPGLLSRLSGLGAHCAVHALAAGALLFAAGKGYFRGAFLVFLIHLAIDAARSGLERRLFGSGDVYVKRSEFVAWISGRGNNPEKMNLRNLRSWFAVNLLDQGLHLASLYFISKMV